MFIPCPDITSPSCMKTLNSFSHKIEFPIDTEEELFAIRRIDRVVRDETRLFEKYVKMDNSEIDTDPTIGKFRAAARGKAVEMDYNPETGKPICMTRKTEDGNLKSYVKWDDEGEFKYIKEIRNFCTQNFNVREKVEIKFDNKNGHEKSRKAEGE
jgi:hypothetical protein